MVQTSNRDQNLDRTRGGAANRRHQELRDHWSQALLAALQMHEWPKKTETEVQLDQAKNIAATTHNEPPSPPLHLERADKWLLPRAWPNKLPHTRRQQLHKIKCAMSYDTTDTKLRIITKVNNTKKSGKPPAMPKPRKPQTTVKKRQSNNNRYPPTPPQNAIVVRSSYILVSMGV